MRAVRLLRTFALQLHPCKTSGVPTSARPFCSTAEQALHFVQDTRDELPVLAQRMLDDGVLAQVEPTAPTSNDRILLRRYLNKCRTPEERHEAVVSFTFLLTRFRKGLACCPECLFLKERCICSAVSRIKPQHKLCLFQHVSEIGRNNNTGSILRLVVGAERTIRGVPEQQDRLLKQMEERSESTAILFPNSDSVTLEEYQAERVKKMGEKDVPLTLVLLDGTSRQAKNFDGFLPRYIPRIRIKEMDLHSWLNPIRRQTEEHRVCTAQAAAMILDELGDKTSSRAIERAVKYMVRLAVRNRYIASTQGRKNKRHTSTLFTS